VVVNIESSHCYSNVPAFAQEVSRVLAPGGWFTFADMRSKGKLAELDSQLDASGLERMAARELSPGVIKALDAAEIRKRERIDRVWFMRRFMAEFSGAKGSILYKGLKSGAVVYVARRFRKPA
jgi:hypothetical protein